MHRKHVELAVGIFGIIGILCLAWLSVRLGRMEVGDKGYPIHAEFANCGGLRTGASVTIAGVEIGRVRSITLSGHEARVEMIITPDVRIREDAIVAVKTRGLIGEKFLAISPGGSDKYLEPGAEMWETQSAIDLEDLIGKFAFGDVSDQ